MLRSRIRFPYVPNYLFYIMVAPWHRMSNLGHGPGWRFKAGSRQESQFKGTVADFDLILLNMVRSAIQQG